MLWPRNLITPCFFAVLVCFGASSLKGQDELPSIAELQQAYIKENGGLYNLASLNSMFVRGRFVYPDSTEQEFKLYRKRPNLSRYIVEGPKGTQGTLFDGERGVRIFEDHFGSAVVIEMEERDVEVMRFDSHIDGVFFRLRNHADFLTVLGVEIVNGEEAYRIRISADAGVPLKYLWIDISNFREVMMRRSIEQADGSLVEEELVFSKFAKVNGVWLSQEIENLRDGEVAQTIYVDQIRVNVGVFDSFFDLPESND